MDCHIKTKYFHEKNCKKKIFNAFIDILKLSIKKLGELQKNPTPPTCWRLDALPSSAGA